MTVQRPTYSASPAYCSAFEVADRAIAWAAIPPTMNTPSRTSQAMGPVPKNSCRTIWSADAGGEQGRLGGDERQDRPGEVAVGPANERGPLARRGLGGRVPALVVAQVIGLHGVSRRGGPPCGASVPSSYPDGEPGTSEPGGSRAGPGPRSSSPSRSPRTPTSSGRTARAEAFVIDPGFEPELILDVLRQNGLTLAAIVCTHGHVDHIAGNADLKAAYPDAPILIGHGDAEMLTDADAEPERPVRVRR